MLGIEISCMNFFQDSSFMQPEGLSRFLKTKKEVATLFLNPSDYASRPEHPGSAELKANMNLRADCPIPFSDTYGWDRWGMLGVMADYVLTWVKGDIIEIGIGESSYLFTYLARKFNRKVFHCDIMSSDYINLCTVGDFFDDNNVLFVGPSDDFFEEIKFTKVSVVFIDGDHMYDQVKKDFNNSFNLIEENGFIFMHDLYPMNEEETAFNRSGNGYKFRKELERRSDIDIFTFHFGAWNAGLTMVRKIPKPENPYRESGRINIHGSFKS